MGVDKTFKKVLGTICVVDKDSKVTFLTWWTIVSKEIYEVIRMSQEEGLNCGFINFS